MSDEPKSENAFQYGRPWLAVALTLVLPGLGHVYQGHRLRGICGAVLVVVGYGLAMPLAVHFPAHPWNVVLAVCLLLLPMLLLVADTLYLNPRSELRTDRGKLPWRQVGTGILIAVIVIGSVFLYRWLFYQTYQVHGSSMRPTLQVGDRFIVSKHAYGGILGSRMPRRGDVVIFSRPDRPETMSVSRVVALPGDTIEIIDHRAILNGNVLEEPYLPSEMPPEPLGPGPSLARCTPVTVPAGTVFLLGDFRVASADSRYFGTVPIDAVHGRALTIFWSRPFSYDFDMRRIDGEIQWDRIGIRVR